MNDFDSRRLVAKHDLARSRARVWEYYVHREFSQGDQLSIMGLLAFLEDTVRGFRRHDNQKAFTNAEKLMQVGNYSRRLLVTLIFVGSTQR